MPVTWLRFTLTRVPIDSRRSGTDPTKYSEGWSGRVLGPVVPSLIDYE